MIQERLLRLVIAIPTAGRREQLSKTLRHLNAQERLPDAVYVCPAGDDDYDPSVAVDLSFPLEIVRGRRGSCAQRNAILDRIDHADVIVFLDDDYYPAADYLAQAERMMRGNPDVVLFTSWPELDGATGPGVSHECALEAVNAFAAQTQRDVALTPTYGGYGCNMVTRGSVISEHGLRFDENLPLYGWLEDIDFSRRLAAYGRIVGCEALRGVHLGVKNGRNSGVRMGYSQIANPIFLMRKGSLDARYATRQMARNLAKNIARSTLPEPWIDRRGRLRGNFLALRDYVLGRLDPQVVTQLK